MQAKNTRHFYALKNEPKGEVPYVFEKVADRNKWLEKYTEAKPASATEVYKILRKSRTGILASNRNNRVYIVDSIDDINIDKGQKLILSWKRFEKRGLLKPLFLLL